MFTNSKNVRKRPQRTRAEMATLRVYVNNGKGPSGIYEENVVGGYKNRAGEVVLLVREKEKAAFQLHRLEPKLGICRELGVMSSEIQEVFESTKYGQPFFLRNIALEKLEKQEVLTSVFSLPVWHLAAKEEEIHARKIVPLQARMLHKSRYQPMVTDLSPRASSEASNEEDDVEKIGIKQ